MLSLNFNYSVRSACGRQEQRRAPYQDKPGTERTTTTEPRARSAALRGTQRRSISAAHSHAASGYADGLRNPRRQQIASGLETAAVFKAPAPILGCLTIRHYPRASCSEFCITWQYRSPSFPGAPQCCCSGSRMSEFH